MRAAPVRFVLVATLAYAAGLALPAGCASPETRFYVLNPVANTVARPSAAQGNVVIGVGPIELPPYLDRPQLVRRTPGNELDVDEFSQWAEPLQDGFTRALGENLSRLVPTERVVFFPWRRVDDVGYQVVVQVIRFDADEAGEASLDARWSIVQEEGKGRLVTKRSSFTEAAGAGDHGALAAAMSAALGDLSEAIAAEIRGLSAAETGS